MALSVFDNKQDMPTDEMAAVVMGEGNKLLEAIRMNLAANYKNVNEEWKFYGKESGWTKNIKSGKRTLFMLVPMSGKFQVYFTLGEKAVAQVHTSDLPAAVKALIPDAAQCVCGFGFRFDVELEADADSVIKLTAIKDKN
ncbi:MAG: DUF3788 domain-containing protein [Firmicutes bacterium]|nr:DUF3788 domain-containing protein [Bacillota bacterium]